MPEGTVLQTPQQRLQAADEAFKETVRVLPPNMQIAAPPWTELTAALDGLVRLLIEKGDFTEQEVADAKMTRWAELLETFTEQARELKRQHTGLVIAGPGQPV